MASAAFAFPVQHGALRCAPGALVEFVRPIPTWLAQSVIQVTSGSLASRLAESLSVAWPHGEETPVRQRNMRFSAQQYRHPHTIIMCTSCTPRGSHSCVRPLGSTGDRRNRAQRGSGTGSGVSLIFGSATEKVSPSSDAQASRSSELRPSSCPLRWPAVLVKRQPLMNRRRYRSQPRRQRPNRQSN